MFGIWGNDDKLTLPKLMKHDIKGNNLQMYYYLYYVNILCNSK